MKFNLFRWDEMKKFILTSTPSRHNYKQILQNKINFITVTKNMWGD